MTLTAEAVHDWATWALLATRVPFQRLDQNGHHRSQVALWRRVPLITAARGRPHNNNLADAHATFLDDPDHSQARTHATTGRAGGCALHTVHA